MQKPDDFYEVEKHRTYHKRALAGRPFILKVSLPQGRKVFRFESSLLMELVVQMLAWSGRAALASIENIEGELAVSPWTAQRLWKATAGHYGNPTPKTPFIVRGPTINPTFIDEYTAQSLEKAIDFATYWFDNHWDWPYWVHVVGPNGRIVLSNRELTRMYDAEMRAAGRSITESIIQTDGSLLGKKLSERRVV